MGVGHASKVYVRLSPPAKAYYFNQAGQMRVEEDIFTFHNLEIPYRIKRLWGTGGFCKPCWHYMYAEYEDIEGNVYYSIQSGYSNKSGPISELKRKQRIGENEPFWDAKEKSDWLDDIDSDLKIWAEHEKEIYKKRIGKN